MSIKDKLRNIPANNALNAKAMFDARMGYYHENSSDEKSKVRLMDHKFLYGRVDRQALPVIAKNKNVKRFNTNTSVETFGFVVDAFEHMKEYIIVQTQASSAILNYSHLPILQLNVDSAKENFNDQYQDYMTVLYNSSLLYFKRKNMMAKITDFHTFIECFLDFARRFNSIFPLTKTGFLLSRFCTSQVSGLMIDLGGVSISDDAEKTAIINSPAYEFVKSVAKKFGFLVDFDLPTRLIFNVNSPAAQRYFNMYNLTGPAIYKDATGQVKAFANPHQHTFVYTIFGEDKGKGYTQSVIHNQEVIGAGSLRHVHSIDGFVNVHEARHPQQHADMGDNHYHEITKITKDNFFDKFYSPVIQTDIDGTPDELGLRQTMFKFYNKFVTDFPVHQMHDHSNVQSAINSQEVGSSLDVTNTLNVPRVPGSNIIFRKTINRTQLSVEEFNLKYSFNYFLPIYIKFRLIERGVQVVEKQTADIIKKFNSYMLLNDFDSSLKQLDSYINKEIRQAQLTNIVNRVG